MSFQQRRNNYQNRSNFPWNGREDRNNTTRYGSNVNHFHPRGKNGERNNGNNPYFHRNEHIQFSDNYNESKFNRAAKPIYQEKEESVETDILSDEFSPELKNEIAFCSVFYEGEEIYREGKKGYQHRNCILYLPSICNLRNCPESKNIPLPSFETISLS
eukprot:TRINITY_DN10213_c0_g1_i6.p1 TRINITY_DN10213_c0_g1~~TRINITY_DN10213_c0_g1_i6.p1  ORF type:complete len:159 (-),score=26.35 TRINITY_DN10213_c0_g1_i6:22-498(-)